MKTKRKNKKKNQPDNGGFTTGCGMIAFILPSITINAHNIPAFSTRSASVVCQHFPRCTVHIAAIACQHFSRSHRAAIFAPMPAFSTLPPPCRHPSCRSRRARCSHVRMCPTGVVIVGGLADSYAMGSCVHCIQAGVYESEA